MTNKSNKLSSTRKNPIAVDRERAGTKEYGVFVGTVVSAADLSKTGKLTVHIPNITNDPDANFTCNWSSPFAGITASYNIGKDVRDFRQTQTSYGMWMVPPDPGNLVLVIFAEGDISRPYVIACLHSDRYHHMVPGIPAGTSYGDPGFLTPVAEKNRRDQPSIHDAAVRPVHADLARNITEQGLINDPVRGAGDSGSRRESPSEVFGILTPGRLDEADPEFRSRYAGHQFVMDDNEFSRMIRLRSGGGSQILLDDVNSSVYMINANGECWLELDSSGNMQYYAQNSINFRTNGNFNIRADGSINMEAGNDVNIKAAGDTQNNEYVGGSQFEVEDGNTPNPPGLGGRVNITAKSDINAVGDNRVLVRTGHGDIDMYSKNALNIQADGQARNGAAINMNAKAGGGINMSASRSVTMDAQLIAGVASQIQLGGGTIFLNTGTPSPVPAQQTIRAARLNGSPRPDVSTNKPRYDYEAARRGDPALVDGGARPNTVPSVHSIVTSMPTPEPYAGHFQYTPSSLIGVSEFDAEAAGPAPDNLTSLPGQPIPGSASAPVSLLNTASIQAHITGMNAVIPPNRVG